MTESMFDLYVSMVESMEEPDDELMHKGVKGMKWKNHVYANWKVGAQSIKNYAKALKKKLSKKLKKFGKGVKKHAKGYYKYTVDRTTDNIDKGVKKVKKGAKTVKNHLSGETLYRKKNKKWNKVARGFAKDVANKKSWTLDTKLRKQQNKQNKNTRNALETAQQATEHGVNAAYGTKRLMETTQGEMYNPQNKKKNRKRTMANIMSGAYIQGYNESNYKNQQRKKRKAKSRV